MCIRDSTDIVAYQYASGEDGPTHHDDGSARACGYPGIYSMGMLHGGALATYAVNWLGPDNIRRFKCRFVEMQFPGDVLTYRGWVVRQTSRTVAGWSTSSSIFRGTARCSVAPGRPLRFRKTTSVSFYSKTHRRKPGGI